MTASIVIPLHNRIDLTTHCLRTIREHSPEAQVILVDNASTDLTSRLPVAVRNEDNLGFARACNQGALGAEHPLLVFLNNDTEVRAGWLYYLTQAFEDQDVGVVGAQLQYPGGSIQSAGISVDFSRPSGQEARNIQVDLAVGPYDVAAVTGACLAIRTQLFRDLGGFDEGYFNGYEDVDLCLRARAAGHRVRYEPASVVLHYESQSGPARWAMVRENVQRLRARWEGQCPTM